jgi:hypothetical protein
MLQPWRGERGELMRKLLFVFAAFLVLSCGAACNDSNDVTSPGGLMPAVTRIVPNPTHANSMLIFHGTHFDQTSTFTLQQGGVVKATLSNVVFATGSSAAGIQINATIPAGTPLGMYAGCVTTAFGTACNATAIEVF